MDSRGLRQRKTASGNGMEKHGRLIIMWFDLKSRAGFCWRGSGRPFHGKGPKTEKAWEPTLGSLVQGVWRLTRVSEAERRVWEGV